MLGKGLWRIGMVQHNSTALNQYYNRSSIPFLTKTIPTRYNMIHSRVIYLRTRVRVVSEADFDQQCHALLKRMLCMQQPSQQLFIPPRYQCSSIRGIKPQHDRQAQKHTAQKVDASL
jgi:hypothetical protein